MIHMSFQKKMPILKEIDIKFTQSLGKKFAYKSPVQFGPSFLLNVRFNEASISSNLIGKDVPLTKRIFHMRYVSFIWKGKFYSWKKIEKDFYLMDILTMQQPECSALHKDMIYIKVV